jgi:hypothetical protein
MNIPFSVANNWEDFPEFQKPIVWKIGNREKGICLLAEDDQFKYKIRKNDFPDEPLYSLISDDAEIFHFDDWPNFWTRPNEST